jgi:F0F1-type ATP synthase delta subunit
MKRITKSELALYAVNQIEAGVNVSTLAKQLAAYLLEERRSREMSAIMRAVDEELARRGSAQVTITSAHAVSDETKKQLATLLEVKNPQFTEVIDLSVVGGAKARSGETEIDLTVRNKLNKFKTAIMRSK